MTGWAREAQRRGWLAVWAADRRRTCVPESTGGPSPAGFRLPAESRLSEPVTLTRRPVGSPRGWLLSASMAAENGGAQIARSDPETLGASAGGHDGKSARRKRRPLGSVRGAPPPLVERVVGRVPDAAQGLSHARIGAFPGQPDRADSQAPDRFWPSLQTQLLPTAPPPRAIGRTRHVRYEVLP